VLNNLGITDANAARGGYFSLGSSVSTGGWIYGNTGYAPSDTQLILDVDSVPEPVAMGAVALAGVTLVRRRRA